MRDKRAKIIELITSGALRIRKKFSGQKHRVIPMHRANLFIKQDEI